MKKLIILINTILLVSSVYANDTLIKKQLFSSNKENIRCTIPIMEQCNAPVIDGKLTEMEWLKSVKFCGFLKNNEGLIGNEQGYAYIGIDDKYLYIATHTTTPNLDPGGGLLSKAKKHDSAVYRDDSIEIIINAPSSPNTTFHIIVNSSGTVFDRTISYKPDNSNIKWNLKDLKVASRAISGWWVLEVRIPLKEIGNITDKFKFNIVRNWCKWGTSSIAETKGFANRKFMIKANVKKDIPAFKMNSLGTPEAGSWDVELQVENIVPGKEYIVASSLIQRSSPQGNGNVKSLDKTQKYQQKIVSSNQKIKWQYKTKNEDKHALYCILMDAQTQEVLFSRTVSAKKGVSNGRYPATLNFYLGKKSSGSCFYYPGFNKTLLDITIPNSTEVAKLKVSVKGPDDYNKFYFISKKGQKYIKTIPIGDKAGKYTLSFDYYRNGKSCNNFPNVFVLEKRKFNWENNNYGKDRIIIPPFTPVKANNKTRDVILRKLVFNSQGVLDSIIAKDREILADKMHFKAVIDGKLQQWTGEVYPATVRDKGYDAVWNAQATSSDGLKMITDSKLEYDGFIWNKVTLSGIGNKKISKLTLVIPLKAKDAKLFHAAGDIIRHNPTGFIPKGNGIVWDSAELVRSRHIASYVVPYIWLGEVQRGISYFIDSTLGFKLSKNKPSARIIREGAKVILEVDIINRPVMVKDGQCFQYGLHCTPVKPKNRTWRKWQYNNSGDMITGLQNIISVHGSCLGYNRWNKFATKNDFRAFAAINKYLTQPSPLHREQAKTAVQRHQKLYDTFRKKELTSLKKSYHMWQAKRKIYLDLLLRKHKRPMIPMLYTDPRLVTYNEDAPAYFKSEWCINPIVYSNALKATCGTKSCMQYLIYTYYQIMKNGMQGIYLDDMFIISAIKPGLWEDIDDEGVVHPPMRILFMRELVKRIATMQYKFGLTPRLLQIHMTNGLLIPCFSFCTSTLGWEDKYGETDYQNRFTKGKILTTDLGLKIGCDSVALGGSHRRSTPSKLWRNFRYQQLTRTQLAMTLPYGVKIKRRVSGSSRDVYWPLVKKVYTIMSKFGHYKDDCSFVMSALNDNAIMANNSNIMIASYRRPGKVLLILGNLKGEAKLKLNIDKQKLQLPDNYKIWNAETGELVKANTIDLKKHDFGIYLIGDSSVLTISGLPYKLLPNKK
jgi:hypothetical protein